MSKYDSISIQLAGKIEGIKRSMNRVAYNAVSAVVMRLDEVSPVGKPELWKSQGKAFRGIMMGYTPGQFRGNWQLGVNQRPVGWLPGNYDPTGARTVSKNIGLIPAAASRVQRYHIVNAAPYAIALEEGHSSQAPYGMVRRVRSEFPQMLAGIVQEIKSEGGRVR